MKSILSVLALAACAALAVPAQADTLVWTGDTTNAATWDRPQGDVGGLSPFGYGTPYNVFQFTVSTSGSYVFTSITTSINYTGMLWDNYTFLYEGSFSPVTPGSLTNMINANDDIVLGNRSESGFTQDLTAGTTYYFITTGIHRAMYGTYTDSITGPGAVLAAVPEPSTYALMALGLAGLGVAARRRKA